jgi:hypothetical protein
LTSKTTRHFWTCFNALPQGTQQSARVKYRLWKRDPFHPSLQFKELFDDLWSVRVTADYRALARRRNELIVWFWIGTHAEYDRLVRRR